MGMFYTLIKVDCVHAVKNVRRAKKDRMSPSCLECFKDYSSSLGFTDVISVVMLASFSASYLTT